MRLSEQKLKRNQIELVGVDEIFTQIQRWNKYFISNYGRLIHKDSKGKLTVVQPSITDGGYLSYTLSKPARNYKGEKVRDENGKPKTIKKCKVAHRLVAKLYVNNPYPGEYTLEDLQVHHKDENRTNNYFQNLMYLCKTKNGRKDHNFIHSIKKLSLYNEKTTQFRTYNDIDRLLTKIGVNVLGFIDAIRNSKEWFKSQDGKWNVYPVNGFFVGVQFYKH